VASFYFILIVLVSWSIFSLCHTPIRPILAFWDHISILIVGCVTTWSWGLHQGEWGYLVLVVFLLSLSVFLSFIYYSNRPFIPFLSSCFQFSFLSSTFFSLKYSWELTCRGGLDKTFFAKGGLLKSGLLPVLRERKSHLFPLHAFIPLLKCGGLCLDARCSYPNTFFGLSLDPFFHVIHLVLSGLFLFFFS
jgi:hypothetical protein